VLNDCDVQYCEGKVSILGSTRVKDTMAKDSAPDVMLQIPCTDGSMCVGGRWDGMASSADANCPV